MIDWIFENKEWVFSGVGVFVINLIIILFGKRKSSTHCGKQESTGKGTVQARDIHGDIHISVADKDEKEVRPKKKVSIRLIILGIPIIILELVIGAILINKFFFSSPIIVDDTVKSPYDENISSKHMDSLSNIQKDNKYIPPSDTKSKHTGQIKGESIISDDNLQKKSIPTREVESIYVNRFKFEGNKIYSDDELSLVISSYRNRKITINTLQEIRNELTKFYIKNGYVNSGAIIPDQKVEDGTITINIVEGTIDMNNDGKVQLEISGGSPELRSYVSNQLKLAVGYGKYPLNVYVLQQQLKIIKQNPRIKHINANLSPGKEKGKSVLTVQIEEAESN